MCQLSDVRIVKDLCFRSSLWQYLESNVQPLLAGLIAYCDRNANLDLLTMDCGIHEEVDQHWIHDLWIDLLNNQSVTTLSYRFAVRIRYQL